MPRHLAFGLSMTLVCAACGAKPATADWDRYQPPDWRKYQARSVSSDNVASVLPAEQHGDAGRVTFHDLKTESDRSLADRLLGAVGRRITYLDRHKQRWVNYSSDSDAADTIDLYTHPDALGSQFGLCGVEKYTLSFDNTGHISTVSMTMRYGVEGALFQKANFDWDYYNNVMCASAPASHAPSYFPAPDSIIAQDAAMLLLPLIDLAASGAPLPYRVQCRDAANRACGRAVRRYLGSLRLEDIDDFSLARCPPAGAPKDVCFTIKTGKGKLGPFPKTITVQGSTYMNKVRVDSVDIDESFTMS